ncbi:MAG: sigma-54 dependent transcriptional regulator [Candidatus Coatesbacteria bacterium]
MALNREILLVVEDEEEVAGLLRDALEAPNREILLARTGAEARSLLARDPAVVLLDIGLPDVSGLDLLPEVLGDRRGRVALMLTGQAEQDSVIIAMRHGAMDYLTKPFSIDEVTAKVDKAFELAARNRAVRELPAAGEAPVSGAGVEQFLVGRSPAMLELYKLIGRLAGSAIPVLIRGESGSGKELVARALHRFGPRPDGPFVAVDCGSLPAGLLEGELFGYERGAFTGAVAAKPGRFELADGGTLFLDEVGNIPMELQAKLLRALQEKATQRLGATKAVSWDARVLSATNADPRELASEGRFREDLLYRLAGVEIGVPPLRERLGDLPVLVGLFLRRWAAGRPGLAFTPEAIRLLEAWSWPGNVRELEHAVSRAAALASGPSIGPESLPGEVRSGRSPDPPGMSGRPAGKADLLTLEEMKRRYAREALGLCGGNRAETARLLGVDPKTLRALLQD